jgi:FHA domain
MPKHCGKDVANLAQCSIGSLEEMSNVDISSFFNDFGMQDWQGLIELLRLHVSQSAEWLQTKYREAPALVLGVGAALALPAIAILGTLWRLIFHRPAARPIMEDRTQRTQPASAWRQQAWLEFTNSNMSGFRLSQGMVRIGRESDNDLCLSDPTVHRYHAVLEHTPEAEYYVSYVGDPDRDGLFVDGRPVERHRLRGGEILQIGSIKLRFAVGAV